MREAYHVHGLRVVRPLLGCRCRLSFQAREILSAELTIVPPFSLMTLLLLNFMVLHVLKCRTVLAAELPE